MTTELLDNSEVPDYSSLLRPDGKRFVVLARRRRGHTAGPYRPGFDH